MSNMLDSEQAPIDDTEVKTEGEEHEVVAESAERPALELAPNGSLVTHEELLAWDKE